MIALPASATWGLLALYVAVLAVCIRPLGVFIARVYGGERTFLTPILGRLERGLYRLAGIKPDQEMGWSVYALHMMVFVAASFLALFALLMLQGAMPLNPDGKPGLDAALAFNVAVSFVTNTNWQSYSGEARLSPFSQMLGLTVQNFLSAAMGMAVLMALVRGMTRRGDAQGIGNFWVDLTRGTLYILLPLSLVFAIALGSQGVVQTFQTSVTVELAQPVMGQEGQAVTQQKIALGPVASQIAIRQLGSNGGGYFNANAAHPFENPTPLSNFLLLLAILLIPAALCHSFGHIAGDARQGQLILAVMTVILIPLLILVLLQEQGGNPHFARLGVDQLASLAQSGGSMEGKEVRHGPSASALWATVTGATSNGSTNAMHDSLAPLAGMVPLLLMQMGEVIFGGVGSGLYGMLIFVLLTVFMAGLMVGRTPDYLGKKIQSFEIKMASIAIIIPPLMTLGGTALAVMCEAGRTGVLNPGAHGFSEVLYAFTSAAANNGSAFAGLSADTPFYNIVLGLVMLAGRFGVILPVLAIAGSLAAKPAVPPSPGSLPTHTPLFGALLVCVVVMVGLLTYVPSLALGPVAEHLSMIEQ